MVIMRGMNGVTLFLLDFYLLFWLCAGQNFGSSQDPLSLQFDPTNGRKVFISWNSDSFLLRRDVEDIMYRRTGTLVGGQTWSSDNMSLWKVLHSGTVQQNFLEQFDKERFCDVYELCIFQNTGEQLNENFQRSTTCASVQNVGVPDPVLARDSVFRVEQKYYFNSQIHVKVERNLKFEYWTNVGGQFANNQHNVTLISCRDGTRKSSLPQPTISLSEDDILFDMQYARSDCLVRYELYGDVAIPGESCSRYVNQNISMEFRLSCSSVSGLNDDCVSVPASVILGKAVETESRNGLGCADCSPTVKSEAFVEYDENERQMKRRIKLEWTFDTNAQGRALSEYKVRTSRGDYISGLVLGERDVAVNSYPYYQRHLFLEDFDGGSLYGYANPLYTAQICAVYDSVCSVDWNSKDVYPVILKDFEAAWESSGQQNYNDADTLTVYSLRSGAGRSNSLDFCLINLATITITIIAMPTILVHNCW